MENKKEIIKIVAILIVVAIIVIYNFVFKEKEEYDYENIVLADESVAKDTNGANKENNNTDSSESEEMNKIKVYVIGEVKSPGVVKLEEGARIEDAIILAGGTTDKSDLSKINLAYMLEDGQKLYVPSIEENFNGEYISAENGEGIIENTGEKGDSKNKIININTADVSELCDLPGVGEALAERIVTYREENGKFKNIEDLKNVSGIGDKKFESLKEFIKVK